ncbi:MAG: hypothetical protein IJ274_04235, partial [Lachnospiraceae bacterium]|nr:hypothetical protein [Lachnospiraceae bacterium]
MEGWKGSLKTKLQRIACVSMALVAVASLLTGCAIEKTNRTKVRDLEYHVVAEEEIPEELKKQIEEKKAADFKLTY